MNLFVIGTFVSTSLSVLGSLFIIFVFLSTKPNFSLFHLVFWLSVSDLAVYGTIFILNLIFAAAPDTLTANVGFYVIAMISGIFGISIHLWNSSIALCFYISLTPRRMRRFLLVNFGLPAVVVTTILVTSLLTNSEQNITHCIDGYLVHWVGCNQYVMFLVAIVGLFGWVFATFTYIYILIKKNNGKVDSLDTSEPIGRYASEIRDRTSPMKMLQYGIVYCCTLVPFVCFVFKQFFFDHDNMSSDDDKIFLYFLAWLVPLQGFLNAVIYGLSTDSKNFLKSYFSSKKDNQSMASLALLRDVE